MAPWSRLRNEQERQDEANFLNHELQRSALRKTAETTTKTARQKNNSFRFSECQIGITLSQFDI